MSEHDVQSGGKAVSIGIHVRVSLSTISIGTQWIVGTSAGASAAVMAMITVRAVQPTETLRTKAVRRLVHGHHRCHLCWETLSTQENPTITLRSVVVVQWAFLLSPLDKRSID